MSPVSRSSPSSESWSGSAGAVHSPPDIIDLDRYMRGARPHTHAHAHARRDCSERLVVDGGGGTRKAKTAECSSYTTSCAKRYSHDSGLSDDGSYGPRHRDKYRRGTSGRDAPRAAESTHSMRNFRVACERALRDQQEQIARVAQLCERLTALTTQPPRPSPQRSPQPPQSSISPDSSEFSSSTRSRSQSRSSRGRRERRKDKIRTDECKTYKIIMTKLDELNRMFVSRGRAGGAGAAGGTGAAARRMRVSNVSSGSVSVSDKLVATEPEPRVIAARVHTPRPIVTRVVERAVGESLPSSGARIKEPPSQPLPQSQAPCCHVDLPGTPRRICRMQHDLNGTHDRLIRCSSTEELDSSERSDRRRTSSGANDSSEMYTQTKKSEPRRTRSAENIMRGRRCTGGSVASSGAAGAAGSGKRPRRNSLCGVCREYWRALTNCIAGQIFYRPTVS